MNSVELSIEFISKEIDSYEFPNATKPLIVGISGPQGSGKSYLATNLKVELEKSYPKLNIVQFSMDDLYLTKEEQDKVTKTAIESENKLLQGRGLPGTHDLQLALEIFQALINNYTLPSWKQIEIPFYEKTAYNGIGDRAEKSQWQIIDRPVDVIIFEGWFNGFTPLGPEQVEATYFTSEVSGILQKSRYYHVQEINDNLKMYTKLWSFFDKFIVLCTDSISNVYTWRLQQEKELIKQKGSGMTDELVEIFVDRYMPMYILYYQHICSTGLPHCSNLMISIDLDRKIEIALYDRQIRLWGMATQLRLRSTKILIINLGAVGTETVKNLVLGGLNTIEILDDSVVKPEDFAGQFFLPNDDSIIGKTKLPLVVDRIRELNNRVNLSIKTESLDNLIGDKEYFKTFDLVIATELDKQMILNLNDITRELNIPLYVSGMHGMFAYILTDLIEHISVSEMEPGNQPRVVNTKISRNKIIAKVEYNEKTTKEIVTIRDEFSPLKDIFKSQELPKQLNKRQLKRLSGAVPLIFALFELVRDEDPDAIVDVEILNVKAREICKLFNIPVETITPEYLQLFSKQAFTEFAPVSAVIGGALAQDRVQ
ncbi:DNA damage tolerance protein RHC31 [Spathaspora sp. JA1]|nr:DNA damage tolerance protein RHC31 [Spathaspora sp. JA1]